MAQMFPEEPREDVESPAERAVFDALKQNLPDDYTVIHGLHIYHRPNPKGRLKESEEDFIIMHPGWGWLAVEVKGGDINYNPRTGSWFSTNARNEINPVKDPYSQASKNQHALEKQIRQDTALSRFNFPCGHAVWFPDISIRGVRLGISSHLAEITLDCHALEETEGHIRGLFSKSLGQQIANPPGPEGIKALRQFLAPSWHFSVNLAQKIKRQDADILKATERQYQALRLISRRNRAAICGPAGSGKTLLAMEKAIRHTESYPGNKVLILCFNKALASHIRNTLKGLAGIDVCNFHNYCELMAQRAGIRLKEFTASDGDDYFNSYLPGLLEEALKKIGGGYDAVIVDEGQDFQGEWWLLVEDSLREPENGLFYIFYDDNQLIYTDKIELPFDNEPFPLIENCRNTRAIHAETMRYYRGEEPPEAHGPEGWPAEKVLVPNPDDEPGKLAELLKRLVNSEGIAPESIVALTPCGLSRTRYPAGKRLASFTVRRDFSSKRNSREIDFSTIHAFKGLEADVVILAELDGIQKWHRDQLMYIGTSRAKHHLVMLEPPPAE